MQQRIRHTKSVALPFSRGIALPLSQLAAAVRSQLAAAVSAPDIALPLSQIAAAVSARCRCLRSLPLSQLAVLCLGTLPLSHHSSFSSYYYYYFSERKYNKIEGKGVAEAEADSRGSRRALRLPKEADLKKMRATRKYLCLSKAP